MNGTLVEDINYLGRTMMMFNKLRPAGRIIEDLLESDWQYAIAMGEFQTFVMPLPFGLFSQSLNLWLKVAPVTIELELVMSPMDALVGYTAGAAVVRAWEINNVQLKCDAVYCTSEFTDQYSQMLLENTPLPVPFSSYAVQMQSIPVNGNTFSVNINRAFTRLRSIWFTFYGAATATGEIPALPEQQSNVQQMRTRSVVPQNQKIGRAHV